MSSPQTRETKILPSVTRRSSAAVFRGSESEAASARKVSRVLAVKVHIDWKDEASRALYNRIRDLSWQSAFYRNAQSIAMLAEKRGWRIDPEQKDAHDISKQYRQAYKGELSGAAYSAAEREVAGAFTRDVRKILAGQPPPQWKPTAALSIRGHKSRTDTGVYLALEDDCFVAYLSVQSKTAAGGCWLRVPLARNVRRDEHQGDVLRAMVSWTIPILKATVQIKQHGIILRLTYEAPRPLPAMGERVATLGPVSTEGRLLLRTETQTKDYTSKLAEIVSKKDKWDLIRRRALLQIGWRKGQARLKRRRLANLSWDDWLTTHLHTWSRQMIDWLGSQGVGTLRVESLNNGDWPADRLLSMLRYKAEDAGIGVSDGADINDQSGARAAKAAVTKAQNQTRKRRQAERELAHQLTKRN